VPCCYGSATGAYSCVRASHHVHLYINSVVTCAYDFRLCFWVVLCKCCRAPDGRRNAVALYAIFSFRSFVCFWLLTGVELWRAHAPTRMYMQALGGQE
jgi:hypothetical protein